MCDAHDGVGSDNDDDDGRERQRLRRENAALAHENAQLRRRLDAATAARRAHSVVAVVGGDYSNNNNTTRDKSSSSSSRHSTNNNDDGDDDVVVVDEDVDGDGGMAGASELLRERAYVEVIRERASDATVLTLYDELLRLRQQCTLYAEAMAETRSYFDEMQRLYGELEQQLKANATPQATPTAP